MNNCSVCTKSFYWYFRPIAILCKVAGIFPVQNILTSDPKTLKVRFVSLANLYVTLFFVTTIFGIWYFCGFIFGIKPSSLSTTVVYVILLRSFMSYWYCVKNSRKLPKLIKLLDNFDQKKNSLIDEKPGYIRSLFCWTINPIIIGLFCFLINFVESYAVMESILGNDLHSSDRQISCYFFGILSTWQTVPLLLYIYFCVRIKINFDIINTTLYKKRYTCDYFSNHSVRVNDDMYPTLQYLRYMHAMLSKSVNELGLCYGNFLAIDQLATIAMIVVNVYIVIKLENSITNLLILTIFSIVIVLTLIVISDEIKKSGNKVIELLQGIQFSDVDEKCRIEIQTFMMQLAAQPIEISAAGYFTIDKHQISSMLSSIATYLIVLLEFQIE